MDPSVTFLAQALFLALINALVIFLVGQLNLGMSVKGFGPSFIAALVIAVLTAGVYWLFSELNIWVPGGLGGVLINLLVAAVVLYVAGSVVQGVKVRGFSGALIAAVAMAVVTWFVTPIIGSITKNF